MNKFEYKPLEFHNGMKAIGAFNDLVTLHAGILDFVNKYESQIETLEKYLSEEDCEKLYYAIAVVPKTIAEIAPTVKKEFTREEGPK